LTENFYQILEIATSKSGGGSLFVSNSRW